MEQLAQQTAGLVKVIGSVMLNPEIVNSILQADKEGATEGDGEGDGGGEARTGPEPEAGGARKKARPVYHNKNPSK